MVNLKTIALGTGLALLAPAAFAQELPLNEASSRQNPAAVRLLEQEVSAGLIARMDVFDAFSGNFDMCSPGLPLPFRLQNKRETFGNSGLNTAGFDAGAKAGNVFIGMRALFEKSYNAQREKNSAQLGIGTTMQMGRVRPFAQIGNTSVAGADVMLGSTTVSANAEAKKASHPQFSAGFDREMGGKLRGVTFTGSVAAKGKGIGRILAGMNVTTNHGRFGGIFGVERRGGKFKPVVGTMVALRI